MKERMHGVTRVQLASNRTRELRQLPGSNKE